MATFGELGPTLLDASDARVSVNPRQSVTRLMYAATFAEGANDVKVSADHSELVDELAAEAAFTGVLVMNEKAVLHLYEAPCDQALSFLAKLKAKACVGELRVLFSSEDCPERVMNEWSEHRVSRPAETVDIDAEDPVDASFELYSTLLKIYERMAKFNDADMMKSNADFVPSSERITAFTKSDKFMSLDEYLEFFHAPIHLELGSEKVWPIQSFMLA